jgi:general stress protein 26
MFSTAQRQQIATVLSIAADCTIATVRPDGWPHATTVSFIADGLSIYFCTWSKSQKAQNIAADARVSVTVNAPYTDWNAIQSVSIAAHAKRVTDAAELERVFALMVGKFPQVGQFVNAGDAEMAIFRIDPEIVSILDYRKGFGHTELVAA